MLIYRPNVIFLNPENYYFNISSCFSCPCMNVAILDFEFIEMPVCMSKAVVWASFEGVVTSQLSIHIINSIGAVLTALLLS